MSIDSFFYVPAGTRNLPLGERVMPSYEAVPEVFGAEEAKADGQPAVQITEVTGEEFEL